MMRIGVYMSPGYSLRSTALHASEVCVLGGELSPETLVSNGLRTRSRSAWSGHVSTYTATARVTLSKTLR